MIGAFLVFPFIWGVFGVLFLVLTGVLGRTAKGAHRLAQGWTRLLLATLLSCALLFYLRVGELNLVVQAGIWAFLFIGGAGLSQWYWARAVRKELMKEEALPGLSRSD